MSLIGISGCMQAGKDLTARIIQYWMAWEKWGASQQVALTLQQQGVGEEHDYSGMSGWQIKKYAGKLKQMASLLLGVPIEKFEDQAFKESFLPEQWDQWMVTWKQGEDGPGTASFKTEQEAIDFMNEGFEDGYEENMVSFHKMTVRKFLQQLGTEAIRNHIHPQAWVNALYANYDALDKWIITDVRFPNEAQAILDRKGIVIRINRPSLASTSQHPSEVSLHQWAFDYTLTNEGTIEELTQKVREMLGHFGFINYNTCK